MKIARVFPRRTSATPTDELAFIDEPPNLFLQDIDEVHICVVFTYDMAKAERLARQWSVLGVPVKMGGPAFNQPGSEFVPGMYVKEGITISSRGCPNHCWFCAVPKREPNGLHELEIKDGNNLFDDNILACSDEHIRKVFAMLKRQKERATFTGGLEARILKPWHCEALKELNPKQMYFAYDTPDDYEPLVEAGKMLREAGFPAHSHNIGCYNLIGYKGDTFEKAEQRLMDTIKAGFMPYAMLYKDEKGNEDKAWRKFQREWCRPAIVGAKLKQFIKEK